MKLTVVVGALLHHHVDENLVVARLVKHVFLGVARIKLGSPLSLEVGRIGQHQLRGLGYRSRNQQILDVTLCGLFDKTIDLLTTLFRVFNEIQTLDVLPQHLLHAFPANKDDQ